jgi:hypothetical protein
VEPDQVLEHDGKLPPDTLETSRRRLSTLLTVIAFIAFAVRVRLG